MKKMIAFALLFTMGIIANAQNYLHLNITEIENQQTFDFCTTEYDSVLIEKEQGCNAFSWRVRLNNGETSVFTTDVLTLIPGTDTENYEVEYQSGCGINYRGFYVNFFTFPLHNPWWTDNYVWKREGESVTLYGGPDGYDTEWSTGSTNDVITVTEPGIYWVHIYNYCGELWDTIQVCNCVEIYRASVDLSSGYNKPTWIVDPELINVCQSVKIVRDYYVTLGYAPYTDGEYIDVGMTSDDRGHIYQLIGVMFDGTECPLTSYAKGTPHVDYTDDNTGLKLNMTLTTPFIEEGSPLSLSYINVYKYSQGSLTIVDEYIPANTPSASYDKVRFNNGQAVLGFMFNEGRDNEELSFANLSYYIDVDDVGENYENAFSVYPNPSNGTFVIEGPTTISICNLMGQVIATSYAENGVHTISLSSAGVYFVKSDEGTTQKVVIE